MGVQISGTTVIDDSRNMRNMATVTATSFHGDGSGFTNLPASGGTITATASGAISNGDPVVINTDGKVAAISGTTITEAVGSEVVHQSAAIYDGGQAVVYDTANDIIKNIKLIKAQAVDSEIMPPNNLTGITNQERETLRVWIEQGANTNN